MKSKVFLVAMLCVMLFSSCEKSDLINVPSNALQSREREPIMTVSITKTDGSTVNATLARASAGYVNSSYFTATLNPGTNEAQSFNATAMTFNEANDKLKVIKTTGGVSMEYENKTSASISIGYGALNLSIQPGNINTTANSIVGEDNNGL